MTNTANTVYAETVFFDDVLFNDNEFTFRRNGSDWKLVGINSANLFGRKIMAGFVELGEQELFDYDDTTRLNIVG